MIDKVSLVVTTCSLFKDMWENQMEGLEKFWPLHPSCFFVTDNIDDKFDKCKLIAKPGEYSDRLSAALKEINSKYIFLTLDDYLICSKVDNEKFNFLIDKMENENLDYCKVHYAKYGKVVDKKNKIRSLPLKVPYEVSLLPGLWKKESLIKLLEEGKTPWETEVLLTKNAKINELKCINYYEKNFYKYVDVVRKGKYLRNAKKYLIKHGYYVSDRPTLPFKQSFVHTIKRFLFNIIPYGVRKRLVKLFRLKSYSYPNY